MERYFRVNHIQEEEQVEAAVVAMEGRAINWFIWWEHQIERRNWETLKTSIIRRFQPDLIQNPYGPMLSLKQTGTVQEFRDEFEMVITPQINIDAEILKGIFINGLKVEIKAELKMHNSSSLAEVMDMAILIENKNEALNFKRKEEGMFLWKEKGPVPSKSQNWGEGYKARYGSSGFNNQGKEATDNRNFNSWFEKMEKKITDMQSSGIRKVAPQLSQEEFQERSRKGLCFKCGEKWNKEHTCKLRHYKLMLVEDSDAEEETDFEEPEIPEEEVMLESKSMHLSLMSKEGIPTMRAFKIKGILKWDRGVKQVEVLIDSGATHNFISKKLVDELELPFKTISGYKVQAGNGEKLSNDGRCEDLTLCMQGSIIKQNFYFLNLEGTDFVLGMEWLTTLGDVEINFLKHRIKWKVQGLDQQIQGDPQLNSIEVSLKTMSQIIQDSGDGCLVYQEGRLLQMEKGVAYAESQDQAQVGDCILILQDVLTQSWGQKDPQNFAIEESVVTQSDAKMRILVKGDNLKAFHHQNKTDKFLVWGSSDSGLSWAKEFDFKYHMDGLNMELDSTSQAVVIVNSQTGHLVDLSLKQGSGKGITAARIWWGALDIQSETIQQTIWNHSSLHWPSKQEVGNDTTLSLHMLSHAVVQIKRMAQALKLRARTQCGTGKGEELE
ncbi:unnamed protein product [Cuscuta epithymum]|uniref:Ty3 transposon capsid-like protein domain-containing protein n=1 Tax=Cuscuta epithymum TaxID=186058 RepID=A0AAV0FRW1_9ASTE|nr:unnamed protein product [Cuscuta epithymum]